MAPLDPTVRPPGPRIRIAAALIVAAGLAAVGLAILAEEAALGAEAAWGMAGWKRITLLVGGVAATAAGTLFLTRPRGASRLVSSQDKLIVGMLVLAAGTAWLVLVARQVADGGFYSDDWPIQERWKFEGYFGAVSTQFEVLGSKPLLAIALPAPYAAFGTNPSAHHVLAGGLVLSTAVMFYFVLRELRFHPRDAWPIASLALLFPWASAVRLWPTGSLNNLAVLLLFAGFLLALRGLRVGGRGGFLIHLAAAACYAASILTYETTTVVALMLWAAYVWLDGWRPALPRAALDISAVVAAAAYTAANTKRPITDISEQLSAGLEILSDGGHLLAASFAPTSSPGGFSPVLTAAILGIALAVLAAAMMRGRRTSRKYARSDPILRWVPIAGVALAVLGLCWAIYVPEGRLTPIRPGLHDRVNVVALYPAVVFVYAVLRSAGCLISDRGHFATVLGCIAIAVGYGLQDLRHQQDWASSASLQESVLAAVELASPPDRSLVLTFGHPGEVVADVPVFRDYWDLYSAARVRTSDPTIEAYPVYAGSRLHCSVDGVTMNYLAHPSEGGRMKFEDNGTPPAHEYSRVVFVDVAKGRHAVIRSPAHCANAVRAFTPGPWREKR